MHFFCRTSQQELVPAVRFNPPGCLFSVGAIFDVKVEAIRRSPSFDAHASAVHALCTGCARMSQGHYSQNTAPKS
jgi:hypothetical protein